MSRSLIGNLCKLAGLAAAIAGLIPSAVLLYQCLHSETRDQLDDIYIRTYVIKSVIAALAGFAVAYLLFRVGTNLRINLKDETNRASGASGNS